MLEVPNGEDRMLLILILHFVIWYSMWGILIDLGFLDFQF